MPVLGSELKMYRSTLVADTAGTNGGVMSSNEVVHNVNNNIFPDVPQSERTAGSTKYRKVFYKNTNSANLPLLNPRVFLDKYTQGDDAVYMAVGTQSDLQSGLGTPKLYGCGKLDAAANTGATSIQVLIENPATQFFANGDAIRITNKADVNAAGQEEFNVVSGTPSLAGSVATITLTTPLVNTYAATDTRVANVYAPGSDLKPTISGSSVATVGNGDLDFNAMTLVNSGTLFDDWTVTFSSSTAYSVSGARSGAVGTGNTLTDFSPTNPATGTPYFTLPASAFSGAWAAADTALFTTNPASIPLWLKRVVPAGAAAISGNRFTLAMDGETA